MLECNRVNGQFFVQRDYSSYRDLGASNLGGRQAESYEDKRNQQIDFDDEARKLFKKLGLPDPLEKIAKNESNDEWMNEFGMPDVVYVHPTTGAKFYIGDESAASNLKTLEKCGIYNIVNAKGDQGKCHHEADSRFKYLRFQVSGSYSFPGINTPEGVLKFFGPAHDFID